MRKILNQKFFERSALKVAPELLGKFLVRKWRGKETAYLITEVEAYHGHDDKASHASRGHTKRTSVMFGPAGHWYIYLIYGMYWMLNVVTGKKDYPSAILIRSVIAPTRLSFSGSGSDPSSPVIASDQRKRSNLKLDGPGRLTKTLHIDKKLHSQPVKKKSGLWIEDRGVRVGNPPSLLRTRLQSASAKAPSFAEASEGKSEGDFRFLGAKIKKGPRIGVDYAGPVWSKKPWRFFID